MAEEVTIPGGHDKGKRPSDCSDESLRYWAENARQADVKDACAAELERRAREGGEQPKADPAPANQPKKGSGNAKPAPQTQIVKRPVLELAGSFRDLATLNARLIQAQEQAHIVSPQTAVGALPEGCSVAISVVVVDVEHETYGIPHPDADSRGLGKPALMRIAGAAGIVWDDERTCRLDDESQPYFAKNQALGRLRDLDGSVRVLKATKTVDLRDGSAQTEVLVAKAKERKRDPEKQLREARQNVAENAETKAMLRAVRQLGIRTSYHKSELVKPFVVVKLQFTGQTDDPKLKEIFARQIAATFGDASAALYGSATAHPGNLLPPPSLAQVRRLPPPPPGSTPADDEALETDGHEATPQNAGGPY